ncbi:MAG: hypothetical protein AAF571_15335 [Verrucomicrobiota bacterium]
MNKDSWVEFPLSVFTDAISGLFGRVLIFNLSACFGLCIPYWFQKILLWPWEAFIYLPGLVIWSLFTGYGLLLYPGLILLMIIYAWKELPHWVIIFPFLAVLYDTLRIEDKL